MYAINRSVAIIKPRQAFVDWANSVSDDEREYTIDDLSVECNAILLPEYDSEEHSEAILEDVYAEVFEIELSSWITDEREWPKGITFGLFKEWFDVQFHSMVFDLLHDEIEKDFYTY
jgi:hypothetical protein